MVQFQKIDCKCVTCGQAPWNAGQVAIPKGWVFECDRCRAGTPGKPVKTVRHCASCREPIVVFGVSGGVRLICRKCAEHDDHLVPLEAVTRERDKARAEMNEVQRRLASLETERDKLTAEMKDRVRVATEELSAANGLLQQQVAEHEDELLAAKIQAAKRQQYGVSERELLVEYLRWSADKGHRGWEDVGAEVERLNDFLERGKS
jgi:hypothetical protein